MTTKIYLVSYVSYTESDNYLYSDVRPFTDEEEARHEFISLRDGAYSECQYGAAWDSVESMSEEERKDEYQYDVTENDGGDTYEVSSNAYEGFKVIVKLETKEVEVPQATDRRKYGMPIKELRDQIAAFTGDKKREAMRKAKIFASHISLRHVSEIVSINYGHRDDEHGQRTEDHNWLEFRWRDLDGDCDTFSIIE